MSSGRLRLQSWLLGGLLCLASLPPPPLRAEPAQPAAATGEAMDAQPAPVELVEQPDLLDANQPLLSQDQIDWLQAHPRLRIGVPAAARPLSFFDEKGTLLGTEPAYATLLGRKLGVAIDWVAEPRDQLDQLLRQGQIDLIAMQAQVNEGVADGRYLKSRPYMQLTYALFVNINDAAIRKVKNLEDKRIALIAGDLFQYDLIRPLSQFQAVTVNSIAEAVQAVTEGHADAFLAPLALVSSYLQTNTITRIGVAETYSSRSLPLVYSTLRKNDQLHAIINAAIDAISPAEHRVVKNLWLTADTPAAAQGQTGPLLTPEERQWLKQHPNLRMGVREHWPPFEFQDDERSRGLVLDLVSSMSDHLGYAFEVRIESDWPQAVERLAEGDIDVIPAMTRTPQQQDRFLFTRSYLTLPMVVVVREDGRFVGDLRELRRERIGVVEGDAAQDYLQLNYPDLNLRRVKDTESGLLALSNGDLDVMVTHIPGVSHTVARLGLSNLRITSITPFQYELRLAVRKDMPTLASILNKGLASLSKDESDAIYNRWINLEIKREIDYTVLRRVILVAMLVVGVFFYWNRKLSKEIAERMRSEEALRLSEDALRSAKQDAEKLARDADAANRAKSEFLANMSHEIRTPMHAIMGYTELLEGHISSARHRGYLDSIKAGSRSLLTLINDILDLSRIEAGKMRLELAPLDLNRLLADVQRIFIMRAQARGLILSSRIEGDLPPALALDETRLRQVLFNLVGNAIKFTHEGRVEVVVQVQPIDKSGDIRLLIQVVDTGIGIPADQQVRIFEAFEQQEGQSTRQYGGTGLGLAISRKLVEMMGGQLGLQSAPGQGSTFSVLLPRVSLASMEAQSADEAARGYRFAPAKILVVDDNATNRLLIQDTLSPEGMQVVEAENGAQAITVAEQENPDLILMDIRMPVMDGYASCEAIRRHPQLKSIPVIALTASVMPDELSRIRQARFDGFLRKPVGRAELLTELARYLTHEVLTVAPQPTADPALIEAPELDATQQAAAKASLETHFLKEWRQVRESGDPQRIRRYATALREYGVQQHLPGVTAYGASLQRAVDGFDLDRMNRLLDQFPEAG